jgi:cytochrome c biogenesis protein CcmG, thiol:disulfide interchange protein DsbE
VAGTQPQSMSVRRIVLVFVLPAVLLLGGIGYVIAASGTPATPAAAAQGSVVIGFSRLDRPAPAIDLPSLDGGGSISLASLAGKPVILNFWSTTCTICKQETRALVSVANLTRGRVVFLGIDTLDERGPAIAFARRYQIPYQLAFDPTEAAGARYGLPGLPATFFLSASTRRILGVNFGALTRSSLATIIHKLYGIPVNLG